MRKLFIIISLIMLSGLVACNKSNRSIESGQNVLVKSSDTEVHEPDVDNSTDSENDESEFIEGDCLAQYKYDKTLDACVADFEKQNDGKLWCQPEWNCNIVYDCGEWGPLEPATADLCLYDDHKIAVAGTYLKDGKPVCDTWFGTFEQPAQYRPEGARGWRCAVEAPTYVDKVRDYDLANYIPGFKCYNPDSSKNICMCEGKKMSRKDSCVNDTLITVCDDDENGCVCNQKPYKSPLVCYKNELYCKNVKLPDNAGWNCTYFDERYYGLECKNDICEYNNDKYSKDMIIILENDVNRIYCNNPKGCVWNNQKLMYKENVADGKRYCAYSEFPGDGFVCKDSNWVCDAKQCKYKDVDETGALDSKENSISKGFSYKKTAGDIVFTCTESTCKCGNVTLAKGEECIRNMPTCDHQKFPGKGFLCQEDKWVCQNNECHVNGTKVPTGATPEGMCVKEQCQCGNTTIQEYMACKDHVVYCGHEPAPGNDFECDQFQWLCKNDFCEVNGKKVARGLVNLGNGVYKCILPSCTVNGVEYENQYTNSEEEPDYALHCNDKNCLLLLGSGCGMGTCSGTDDKWFYNLLTTKDDVCWDDSCACGQGTCGKYSICKNNQCVCANKEFPTTHGGDVCIAEITFSKYTYDDNTEYDYTYWSSEDSDREDSIDD